MEYARDYEYVAAKAQVLEAQGLAIGVLVVPGVDQINKTDLN